MELCFFVLTVIDETSEVNERIYFRLVHNHIIEKTLSALSQFHVANMLVV